jgi:methylase of polypeptide subunit release factors
MGIPRPLLPRDDVARLREALGSAGYTSLSIAARIGPAAVAAVRHNDFRGLLRATEAPDRLATLIRVYLAGRTETEAAVTAALAPLPLERALAAGLVERYGDGLRAGVDLDVYGDDTADWWVLSDLDTRPARGGGRLRPDHVLGIGNAATTLAGATVRRPAATALDVGVGCGAQSLHLSRHAERVTATDISPRALRFAATTAALNGLAWDLLEGDLYTPVRGQRFDLVVSNPPFVVGPASTRFAYRDSGRAGDEVCAALARQAADVLTEGGLCQFLGNWLHVVGADWHERVAGWIPPGCDAWIIQREVSDPVDYVSLWQRDADGHDPAQAATWLDWFESHDVEAGGFGLVTIRRTGAADPTVRVEELRQAVEPPLGTRVLEWFARRDWLAAPGRDLLAERFTRAPGVRLTQEATHDGDDWAVGRQVLSLDGGARWADEVDPILLALVSGADGRTRLRDQVSLLAAAFEAPEPAVADAAVRAVARYVERGFLTPADAVPPGPD